MYFHEVVNNDLKSDIFKQCYSSMSYAVSYIRHAVSYVVTYTTLVLLVMTAAVVCLLVPNHFLVALNSERCIPLRVVAYARQHHHVTDV